MKLKDKAAVITGGSSGIGLAIAREFKANGARVIISGRNAERLEEACDVLGDGAFAVQGDVSNLEDLDRLMEVAKLKFGKIDALVANAGVARLVPMADVDEKFFDEISETNFKGLYFTVQKAAPLLSDGASVVLISSIVNQMGMLNFSVYAATKSAVRSLARSFSAELLPRGIRVNTLSPGPIDTPIIKKLGLSDEELEGMGKMLIEMSPMKRFGTPEEMAKAALFLASPDSSYMAGAEIVADGGFTQI